jgi:hypothetical protein
MATANRTAMAASLTNPEEVLTFDIFKPSADF